MKEVIFYLDNDTIGDAIERYVDLLDVVNTELIYDYNYSRDYDEEEFKLYLYAEQQIIDAVYNQIKLLEELKQ